MVVNGTKMAQGLDIGGLGKELGAEPAKELQGQWQHPGEAAMKVVPMWMGSPGGMGWGLGALFAASGLPVIGDTIPFGAMK